MDAYREAQSQRDSGVLWSGMFDNSDYVYLGNSVFARLQLDRPDIFNLPYFMKL